VTRVGVISDTHGLLRPEATAALAGCDPIIHAGDIGDCEILDGLSSLATVIAVRGNNDHGAWAERLPHSQCVRIAGVPICVLHDLASLDFDPSERDVRVVVTGHSHRPLVRERDGVLYVNPGSAGPRRFKLPVAVAHLTLTAGNVTAGIVELAVANAALPRRAARR
jgi:uncharacterized protein